MTLSKEFLPRPGLAGVEGSTIDLGSGIMIPVREVVDQVVTLVGTSIKPSFGALPDRPAEEIRAADLAYAQDRLGWRPATFTRRGPRPHSRLV